MLRLIREWRPDDALLDDVVEHEQPHGTDEVVEPTTMSSEEVHGGDEASCSVENSPNPAEDGEQAAAAADWGQVTDDGEIDFDWEQLMAQAESEAQRQELEQERQEAERQDEQDADGQAEESAPEPAEQAAEEQAQEADGWPPPLADDGEPGRRNAQPAFELDLEALRIRRLAAAFARIIGKLAEDAAGLPVEGDDEWDVDAIMRRRLDRRPLWQCRMSRERERVILLLDTSGSCAEQAELFQRIAEIAERLGDVEIHEAPNGTLCHGGWWCGPATDCWPWHGRVIIFFGDFDGGDAVVEAATRNTVHWFSCENRYADMTQHDWCHHSLAEFRGRYYPDCRVEADIIRLARKLRA